MRRDRVLAEPDAQVAINLRANPGCWYAIADAEPGDKKRKHTLAQVAYRIRQGHQRAFKKTEAGTFEATITNTEHGAAELRARYLPSESVEG